MRKHKTLIRRLIFVLVLTYFPSLHANWKTEIAEKTIQWNTATNNADNTELLKLFANDVIGYGKYHTNYKFVKIKTGYVNQFKNFTQSIVSELNISKHDDGRFMCRFTKKTALGNQAKDYPSYLIFEKQDKDYLIVEEGDEITDFNIGHKPKIGKELSAETVDISKVKSKSPIIWNIIIGLLVVAVLAKLFIKNYLKPRPKTNSNSINNRESTERKQSDENKEKGLAFEKFITQKFDRKYFKLLEWTSDKSHNGVHAEANKHPDLLWQFKLRNETHKFAVECKYRSHLISNQIEVCSERQLSNYRQYASNNNIPVFVVVGMGGAPEQPNYLYIIPLQKLTKCHLHIQELNDFKRYKNIDTNFYYEEHIQNLT